MTFGIEVKSEHDNVQISKAFKFLAVKSRLGPAANLSNIPAEDIVMATGSNITGFGISRTELRPTVGGYAILQPVDATPSAEDMGLGVYDENGVLIYDSGVEVVRPVATRMLSYSGSGSRPDTILSLPAVPAGHTRYVNFDPFARVYTKLQPNASNPNVGRSVVLLAQFSNNYQTLTLKYGTIDFGPPSVGNPAYKIQVVVMDIPN